MSTWRSWNGWSARERRTSIFIGKFDSVIGIEYQTRKANQRFGITPSLIARYTVGTPIGIKVRSRLGPNDMFVLAGALTNGSSVIEPFHFYDETDSNAGKTASGRIAIALPLPFRLELGVSGIVRRAGSRARQPASDLVPGRRPAAADVALPGQGRVPARQLRRRGGPGRCRGRGACTGWI